MRAVGQKENQPWTEKGKEQLLEPGMGVHTCDPSTQEFSELKGQLGLHRKLQPPDLHIKS